MKKNRQLVGRRIFVGNFVSDFIDPCGICSLFLSGYVPRIFVCPAVKHFFWSREKTAFIFVVRQRRMSGPFRCGDRERVKPARCETIGWKGNGALLMY